MNLSGVRVQRGELLPSRALSRRGIELTKGVEGGDVHGQSIPRESSGAGCSLPALARL